MRHKLLPTSEEIQQLRELAKASTPMVDIEKAVNHSRQWIRIVLDQHGIEYHSKYARKGDVHRSSSKASNSIHWMDYVFH